MNFNCNLKHLLTDSQLSLVYIMLPLEPKYSALVTVTTDLIRSLTVTIVPKEVLLIDWKGNQPVARGLIAHFREVA